MSAMNREVGGDEEGYEGAKKKKETPHLRTMYFIMKI